MTLLRRGALAASLVLAGLVLPQQALSATDPSLDLSTPRRTVHGYLSACREGDYLAASEHLDLHAMSPKERSTRGATIARQLKVILDRTLWLDLDELSDEPRGDPDDGLPADRDRVGKIASRDGTIDVLVERVRGAHGARPWKLSAATLAQVPALYTEFGYGELGRWLPDPFFELSLFEMRLWQWLGVGALLLVAAALSWLGVWIAQGLARPVVSRSSWKYDDQLLDLVASPARLGLAVGIFAVLLPLLALSVPAQQFLSRLQVVLALTAVTWLTFRLIDVSTQWLADRLAGSGQISVVSILPPGRRVVKVLLGGLALLVMLQNLGVNVTALLAGLGVGGIAVALAAQRTLENLFGGISLMSDQPVRVGDFCRFGEKLGTVEDIGLRSTRVRTLDRTVVTIPNAEFSKMELDNYSRRDRIWYHPRIGLRYETTPDQLRYVLVEVRRMLYSHPRVLPDPARIRFVEFGAYSLDLEVFAYVDTRDFGEFLEIAEDLNLRIMDIVSRAGSGFAFPSQTTYLETGEGLDLERRASAEAEVARWRDEKRLG
jgi:MscS family membrane protein